MQRLEASDAVRPLRGWLGVKGLIHSVVCLTTGLSLFQSFSTQCGLVPTPSVYGILFFR